ncbi:MAG: hypothetical protein N2491_01775 [Negativicutes bacterium]|nr:hypothetical protein [Negativicutes bacterium]
MNISLDKARQMEPADLTKEDAELLLSRGISKQAIKRMYGFKSDPTLYNRLTAMGLHRCKSDEQDTSTQSPRTPAETSVAQTEEVATVPANAGGNLRGTDRGGRHSPRERRHFHSRNCKPT